MGEGQLNYDPDLAHPAADYNDAETGPRSWNVNERKLIRKIDLRVVPVLSILYLLAFLDRMSLAYATIVTRTC